MLKRYQKGSLQRRKHGKSVMWVGLYRDASGSRRYRTLGPCSKMSHREARVELDSILHPINLKFLEREGQARYTFREYVESKYLPFCQRKWKESTAQTSKQRIESLLLRGLGGSDLGSLKRERLQDFLEQTAASGLSASVVSHIRWDLRAIFQLAVEDGVVDRNPATSLVTPANASRKITQAMSREEVVRILAVLELRERLIVRLAVFAGMRPGEIFGLKWRHVGEESAVIEQRIYRGKIGTPKSHRSVRTVAFTPNIAAEMKEWRGIRPITDPDAWVFPSERLTTPLSRDNWWRRNMEPQLRTLGLQWANFQVMRRTHASLARRAGIDPKVVADQLGHGLGVNLDVYTKSDLAQRAAAVKKLEIAVTAA